MFEGTTIHCRKVRGGEILMVNISCFLFSFITNSSYWEFLFVKFGFCYCIYSLYFLFLTAFVIIFSNLIYLAITVEAVTVHISVFAFSLSDQLLVIDPTNSAIR